MSQSSSDDEGLDLFLPDGTLIHGARVVQQGQQYDTTDGDEAEVVLQDTTVLSAGGVLYRAICVQKNDELAYHQLKPESEEAVIINACKGMGLKPSFTRWVKLIRENRWPVDGTDAERGMFRSCLLSGPLVDFKMAAKRARDAASRLKRKGAGHDAAEPAPKKLNPTDAHIEINASGSGAAVIEILKQLVGGP